MEKYLRLYAEPETKVLEKMLTTLPDQQHWSNVVVIPACNEGPAFLRPSPPCKGRSLMILVINESASAQAHVRATNQELATAVHTQFSTQWQSGPTDGLTLLRDPKSARDLLLVDRFSAGRQLPLKGGVGHARKIGADLASWLINHQRIDSHWIHCSDADVQLPDTYFSYSNTLAAASKKYAAINYPFRHRVDPDDPESVEVARATQLYEFSLHYYVAGMKFAGSPYAFHTIGSTLAVNAHHYAKVRGFPKREAGEDFYLLNKLAKLAPIHEPFAGSDCKPILIKARRSERVPFGTGAAVNKISAMADPVSEYVFYNPGVFVLLRDWLQALPTIWDSGSTELSEDLFQGRIDVAGKRQGLIAGLKEVGTQKALEHAFRQSRDQDQFTRQVHTWFDAFRTLKLIHYLRDQRLPSINHAALRTDQIFQQLSERDEGFLVLTDDLLERGLIK